MLPDETPWHHVTQLPTVLDQEKKERYQQKLLAFNRHNQECDAPNQDDLPDEDGCCFKNRLSCSEPLVGEWQKLFIPKLFLYAAEVGNTAALITLIDESYLDMNALIPYKNVAAVGVTALYIAAENEREEAVKFLIARGAHVNRGLQVTPAAHWSPLHATVASNSTRIAEQLIIAGANPFLKQGVPLTPREHAHKKTKY
jgi:ankyrin repeat protein